jgi:ankyrin repeat protein/serine/threonine protein kinase
MSSTFSGRPETSRPLESDKAESTPATSPEGTNTEAPFVPNVFDLVHMGRRAELSVVQPAMQLYLGAQAVDQSSFLGEGASFEVSSKKMPRSEGFVFETRAMGLTLSTRQAQHDERTLVYKTARIAFSNLGEPLPTHRRAMDSVMMEIYALMHPPLYEHANIVTLLALGWGTNPFESSFRLPVLVTEYADHGNLADLQARETLTSEMKLKLSLDIAYGLQVLHRCGIIHGDLKSENVLIFSHPHRTYIAKLGDFGFSIVGQASAPQVNIGGTMPWRAPESQAPVARDFLTKTDIYSYGLTIWRLAMDGGNPFAILHEFGPTASSSTLPTFTSQLREQDLVAAHAQLKYWYQPFVLFAMGKLYGDPLIPTDQVVQLLQRAQVTLRAVNMDTRQGLEFLKYMLWLVHRLKLSRQPLSDNIGEQLVAVAVSDVFYGKLNAVLAGCLPLDPRQRDLSVAISSLSSTNGDQQHTNEPSGDMFLRQSFDHHFMSWQAVRDLQPSVQTFLFERFRARADDFASRSQVNTPECFVLASFYMNGYGTQRDLQKARRLIFHAAKYGHQVAQANAWRVAKVTESELEVGIPPEQILERQAFNGSRGALQDLASIAPARAAEVKRILKAGLAGIGASFWGDDLLHGHRYGPWINTFRDTTILVQNMKGLRQIAEYRVNKRGDRILHMAASCGHLRAVEALLDNFPSLTVDHLNDVGETPLLSACRSGHRDVVESFLSRGADPTIATTWHETSLHWLISFDEDEVKAVGQALIAAGADAKSLTTRSVNYSPFPSGIDVDNLPPGTPLTWAVHHDRPDIIKFLLSYPESASLCVVKAPQNPTPLEWAAHYHHRHCLEAMVDVMKEQKIGFTFQEFLKSAVHSADMFSMVLRNGVHYLQRMKDTLDYLLEETHGASFATGLGGFGYTLLYYATSEGHDLVAKYLLAPETEALLQMGRERWRASIKDDNDMPIPQYGVYSEEHINTPCGIEQRTPLLECIRWNHHELFDLLLSRGADVHARSRNPFDGSRTDWSALHAFAYAAQNSDLSLLPKIIEAGVEVDAQISGSMDLETPLLVALKNNAFNLAEELQQRGAKVHSLCTSSGLITLEQPTTVLGHLIASAARGTVARLQLVLSQAQAAQDRATIFVVEPNRQLTVFHLAARAHKGVFERIPDGKSSAVAYQRSQYDAAQNRDILNELLQHFGSADEVINARTGEALFRRTALHLAVDAFNLNAVELLLDRSSLDGSLQDSNGQTALDLAYEASLHQNTQCDGPCQRLPLPGRRWRCTKCADHDLCETCYRDFQAAKDSQITHAFEEMTLKQSNDAAGKPWLPRVPAEQLDLVRIIELLEERAMRDRQVSDAANALQQVHV